MLPRDLVSSFVYAVEYWHFYFVVSEYHRLSDQILISIKIKVVYRATLDLYRTLQIECYLLISNNGEYHKLLFIV